MSESDVDTQRENEIPMPHDPDVAEHVMARIVREQVAPMIQAQGQFLRRQEARDERHYAAVKDMLNKATELYQRLGQIEARLQHVEARCAYEHGPLKLGEQSDG